MRIKFLYPRWGFENTDWDTFLLNVKDAGFAGIEWFPYGERSDYNEVTALLKNHGLEYAIVMTVLERFDAFEEYLSALQEQLSELAAIGKGNLPPLHISAQTGREYFSEEQIEQCINCCSNISKATGIPIYHETHRNKWTYAAHRVYPMLQKHPSLELTLDVSHWFCVSE